MQGSDIAVPNAFAVVWDETKKELYFYYTAFFLDPSVPFYSSGELCWLLSFSA